MKHRVWTLVLLLSLPGCSVFDEGDDDDDDDDVELDTGGGDHADILLAERFPNDGEREAQYVQDGIGWTLVLEDSLGTVIRGDVEVHLWEWWRDDTGEVVGGLGWQSDDAGVALHGWAEGAAEWTWLETPIAFTDADGRIRLGSPVVTETEAGTFSVEYLGLEDCPVHWGPEWERCAHIEVDDGDGDDATGRFFVGEYWLIQRYGPAWMLLTGQAGIWNLARYDWEPKE